MLKVKKYNSLKTACSEKYASNEIAKIRKLLLFGLSITALSVLTACGGGGSSSSSSGGGSSCSDISGEPDVLGAITFTPAAAHAGDTVMINIPVDAETAYVGVTLANASYTGGGASINGSGGVIVTVPSPAVQTLQIPVTGSPLAPADSYFPSISLCSVEIGACEETDGSGGVAVTYASVPQPGFDNLSRFKFFANGSTITPTIDQIAHPADSCVAKPSLIIDP
jgi:hypothetical protein